MCLLKGNENLQRLAHVHVIHVPLKSPVGKSRRLWGPGQKRWGHEAITFRVTSFYVSSLQRRGEEVPGREAFSRRLECGEAGRK